MNVYGRTRDDKLADTAEAVGRMMKFSPDNETSTKRQVIGLECNNITACDVSGYHDFKLVREGGFEPPLIAQQDPKSLPTQYITILCNFMSQYHHNFPAFAITLLHTIRSGAGGFSSFDGSKWNVYSGGVENELGTRYGLALKVLYRDRADFSIGYTGERYSRDYADDTENRFAASFGLSF